MLKKLFNRILPTPPAPAPLPAPPVDATPAADIPAADALIVDGNAEEDAGRLDQAEALYRQAVAKAPRHARAHLNLGIVLAAKGDDAGATRAYETVLAIDPRHAYGNYNYARLAYLRGDLARAEALIGEALRTKPEFQEALIIRASVLEALGQLDPAVELLQRALQLRPDDAGAWFNLAIVLIKLKRSAEAEAAVKRVVELMPDHPGSLGLLSLLARDHAFVGDVLEPLRAAIRHDPANLAYQSQELLLLNIDDSISAEDLFRRHVEFGLRAEQAHPARFRHLRGDDAPGRRLRVGYVSADFSLHPAMFFFMPVLEHRDRAAFETFCYSIGMGDDQVTQAVREASDHWLDAKRMTDAELADAIHADAIDILVDLTGHTTVPRLGVFSQRPAPVQASWLGYLNTTGLTRMDFRLTDRRCDPPEAAQPLHTERLKFLPESQWCYRPLVESVVQPVTPYERNGFVTFGSFNDPLKLTPAMCRRWAQVLARVPASRIVVGGVGSERKREVIRQEMADLGVDPGRYEFVARVPLDKYPDLFTRVDLSLDTFPYGGGTTTFDSLWMGVPVVTAVGSTSPSRSAASILAALGLDDWVAPSIDDFVDVAVARAADHEQRAALRRSLRERLQASPLMDAPRFVRDLETLYREMWAERKD
jgi:protein O-GlcNAc transferase